MIGMMMAMNTAERSHIITNKPMDAFDLGKFDLVIHSRIMKGKTSTKLMIAGKLIGAPLTINPTGKSRNAAGTTISGLMGSGQRF